MNELCLEKYTESRDNAAAITRTHPSSYGFTTFNRLGDFFDARKRLRLPYLPFFLFIHIEFIYLHRNLKDALKRRQGAAVGDIETGTACFWGGLLLRGNVGFQMNPTLFAGFDLDSGGCHTVNLRLFIASMPVPLASICRFCRASFRFELTPKCYRLCAKP